MHATSLLILGLATIGSSFTLPKGLPNGAYRAYFNEAGVEVHERVPFNTTSPANTTSQANTTSPLLGRRKTLSQRAYQIWCGCENPMASTFDTNTVNEHLMNGIAGSPMIHQGWTIYAVQDTAVAFVCNVDKFPVIIPADAVNKGSSDINAACGLFIAGTSRLDGPVAINYGYMNYKGEDTFCASSQGGQSNFCCNPGGQKYGEYLSCVEGCWGDMWLGGAGACAERCAGTCTEGIPMWSPTYASAGPTGVVGVPF